MKIVFLNHFISGGGAERVTCLLADQLQKRGHDVIMMTDLFRPFAYHVDENVRKINLFNTEKEAHSKLYLYYMVRNTRAMLKGELPDVIIGVLPIMNLVAIFAARGLKTKVIASHHTPFDRRENIHIRVIKNQVYKWADAVTVLTQADYDYLGNRLPKKVVMPNPLAYPCVGSPEGNRRKNILAVGRLDVWQIKGFDLLIEAWAKIANDYSEWQLEIAGGGKECSFEEIKRIAKDNGVLHRVNFLGFRKDIDAVMRESSIFALTSRIEGFGMVLIEAMSQGCACVSFDDGGRQREIIQDDKEGIVIDGHNPVTLSEALKKLIKDDKLRYEIAENGIKRADSYNIDIIAQKWENLINKIVL